ncbi:hypothetical protein MNBD_NITROSPINAE01-1618 [hydrothermal vent metagenome]|uniref:SGNH hydrolase-type esterase domain-containing protein n=1 Tax=hydrothermal vent metagenome TaxID=652676 RepID=A0A3B1BW77_9ZZZZ
MGILKYTFNCLMAVYLFAMAYFVATGPFYIDSVITVRMDNLSKPILIFLVALLLRTAMSINFKVLFSRHTFFWLFLGLASITLTAVAGEAFLRLIYIDGGKTTSGGPGNLPFEATFNSNSSSARWPVVKGNKKNGVKRILVQGDSITWGNGVREWTDLYPYQLLKRLNQNDEKFEMTAIAHPGLEIIDHRINLANSVTEIAPDIILYQWFVNDLEISKDRPENKMTIWRDFLPHETMRNMSYLYFFLDNRLETLLPPLNRSYSEYMREDFTYGTEKWSTYASEFHKWATLATSYSNRVVMALYPALPFKGEYPFKKINEQVRKLAGAHTLSWMRGKTFGEAGYNGAILKAKAGETAEGYLAYGPYIWLSKGEYEVSFQLKLDSIPQTKENGDIVTLDVVYDKGRKTLASLTLQAKDFAEKGSWETFPLKFVTKETITSEIEFRVLYKGGADVSMGAIDLPIDFGIEVVDLTPHLKGFNTYASMFDAHPNAKAHKIMAEALFEQLSD